ncbi:putative peroxiredoxin [Rosa chinensis]|uniref:glutaredoxin-dependent peroxiredoxin n=1 Tax=Rosa chinensis TaxID=74649 RepID=A0A2P6PS05_ROSCH|nr:putative peroxiredoxin [Rosa chinensis]
MQTVNIHSITAGQKIVGVPNAFNHTFSLKHVPRYIENTYELKSKGVDKILCLGVNNPFVMKAWAKSYSELLFRC